MDSPESTGPGKDHPTPGAVTDAWATMNNIKHKLFN